VLGTKLSRTDLAVLERYGDPRRLATVRRDRLVALIAKVSHGHGDPAVKADALRTAAREALALYGDDPAICFDSLADEMATEIRLIRTLEAERDRHARAREDAYLQVDPAQLARTLPGIAEIGAPMLVAVMGNPDRFPTRPRSRPTSGWPPRPRRPGDRPQGPADVQGRQPAATHPAAALGRDRPPTRPPARRDLLRPDGQQGRGPPQGAVRGRRPARRARLDRHAPRHPLRAP
jgi:hypothetical protein